MEDLAARWLGARFDALVDGAYDGELARTRSELAALPTRGDSDALIARGARIGAVLPTVWDLGATLRALIQTGLDAQAPPDRRAALAAVTGALDRAERQWLREVAALPDSSRRAVMDHPSLAELRPRLDFEIAAIEPQDDRERLERAGPALWASVAASLERDFRAELGGREVGAAVADGLAFSHPDESVRHAAATAREAHRTARRELWSATVDARVVWLTLRSPEDAIAAAFREGRIRPETWQALDACWLGRGTALGRRAVALRSEIAGFDAARPWNRLAPIPSRDGAAEIGLDDALDTIRSAFAAAGPALAASVDLVRTSGWIEAGTRPGKHSGAWMTPLVRPVEPRIVLSWSGTELDALVLAHELGHAHHLLTMRGLPFGRLYFPSTLGELASVFAEHLYRRHTPGGPAARYVASQFDRYLGPLPAFLRFEIRLLRERGERPWTSDRITELWREVHAQAGVEAPEHGWCSPGLLAPRPLGRLAHVVGAALSQLVVQTFERAPEGFDDRLRALLRDTGTLDVEALAERHLGVDLSRPEAWETALAPFDAAIHPEGARPWPG